MKLNPYIGFDGDARAALGRYRDILGGELDLRTFAEFGQTEGGIGDLIMHGVLTTPDGITLMGSDQPGRYQPGARISVIVSGSDEARLREVWDGLSEGSQVVVPLSQQMWGDSYGMCIDPYGVTWQVNIAAA